MLESFKEEWRSSVECYDSIHSPLKRQSRNLDGKPIGHVEFSLVIPPTHNGNVLAQELEQALAFAQLDDLCVRQLSAPS